MEALEADAPQPTQQDRPLLLIAAGIFLLALGLVSAWNLQSDDEEPEVVAAATPTTGPTETTADTVADGEGEPEGGVDPDDGTTTTETTKASTSINNCVCFASVWAVSECWNDIKIQACESIPLHAIWVRTTLILVA